MENCVVTLVAKHCQAVLEPRSKRVGNAPFAPFCGDFFTINVLIGDRFWPVSWHNKELRHNPPQQFEGVNDRGERMRMAGVVRAAWDFDRFTLEWCAPMYQQMIDERAKQATSTNIAKLRNHSQFVVDCRRHVEETVVRTIFARWVKA